MKKFALSVYCVLCGMVIVYGNAVIKSFDWLGKKLVDLIDNSDFFAGAVWAYVVLTAWELLK